MSALFFTVVDNTAPNMSITLDRNGSVIDLTTATSVDLIISKELTGTVTNSGHQTCTITNASLGLISYAPVATDFPAAGRYTAQAKITYNSGKIEYIHEQATVVADDHE